MIENELNIDVEEISVDDKELEELGLVDEIIEEEEVILEEDKKITKVRRKKNYVNNPDFLESMKTWLSKLEDNPKEPLPDYVGECFIQIAERYSKRPNFIGYSFIEEMKSEAVLTCIKYAKNFNPEKSSNPFAYFTQVIKNSFIQMIKIEKKAAIDKFEYIKQHAINTGNYDYKSISIDNFGEN